jgi:hypothetical protein
MKPALRALVAVAVVLAAVIFLFGSWRSRSETSEARLARALLKRDFLERTSVARQLPGDRQKEWRDEVRALTRWYFDEIAAVHARHPGERPRPAEAPRKGKEAESQAEWTRYAEERFRTLREGRYEPLFGAADQGLHLDLLSFDPAPNPAGGEKALRIDFALWGAPRRVDRETVPGTARATLRVVVPVAFKQLAFRFLDDKGQVYGEMTGPGEPYLKLADPERFVEDFPPGVLFGTWYVDAFPHEAARADLTLLVSVRGQAGTDLTASYKIDLPVREEWRLPAGETYKAATREAAP